VEVGAASPLFFRFVKLALKVSFTTLSAVPACQVGERGATILPFVAFSSTLNHRTTLKVGSLPQRPEWRAEEMLKM